MEKLTTSLEFNFLDQNNISEFNVNMKLDTRIKLKNIKIIEHKKKNKIIDSSTKLF